MKPSYFTSGESNPDPIVSSTSSVEEGQGNNIESRDPMATHQKVVTSSKADYSRDRKFRKRIHGGNKIYLKTHLKG